MSGDRGDCGGKVPRGASGDRDRRGENRNDDRDKKRDEHGAIFVSVVTQHFMSSWLREHAAGFTLLNKQLRVLFGANLQGEIHYAEERRELLYLVNLLREAEWTCEGCRDLCCEWCRSWPPSPVPNTPSWLDDDTDYTDDS